MAKLIVFLAIVVLLTFAAVMVAKAVRTAARNHRLKNDKKWELEVYDSMHLTRFDLIRGTLRDHVGSVDRMDSLYGQKFSELQVKCENMVMDRNSSLELSSGK